MTYNSCFIMGRLSISLEDEKITRIDNFLHKNKDYDGYADLFDYMVEDFFTPKKKEYLTIGMLYLGYPFIILTILLKAAAQTKDIFYNYISALITGLLLAGLYLFIRKQRGRYAR